MKVLKKTLKNATEQHDQGSKTNENACTQFEIAFVCLNLITLFTTPQFAAKMIINPVQKIRRLTAVSSIHDGAPNCLA